MLGVNAPQPEPEKKPKKRPFGFENPRGPFTKKPKRKGKKK